MHEHFRRIMRDDNQKFEIPTHDPQTGEVNPYYEELTGNKLPEHDNSKVTAVPETDLDKLDRFLITVSESEVGIRRKILMLNKFIEALGRKEV